MKREERYDFYKGILMLGVVYGHILTALQGGAGITFWIHRFVRTYDMPMFALISGYFLRKSCSRHSVIENTLSKVGSILLPSLIWELFFNLIGGSIELSTNRFWFTYSLFIVSVVIILVDIIKNKKLKATVFCLVVILFHTVIRDPYNVGFLLPAAIVGYYFEDFTLWVQHNLSSSVILLLKASFFFFFLIMQCFWKIDYNIWNTSSYVFANDRLLYNIAIIVFRLNIGILGSIVMSWIFDFLYTALKNGSTVQKRISNWICSIGVQTFELYILQSWFISIAGVKIINLATNLLGYNFFSINISLLLVVFGPIVTIGSVIFMQFLVEVLKKVPIIGKYSFSVPLIYYFHKFRVD